MAPSAVAMKNLEIFEIDTTQSSDNIFKLLIPINAINPNMNHGNIANTFTF